MGTKQAIIEINGKRYDAHTGKLVTAAAPASQPAAATASKPGLPKSAHRVAAPKVHASMQKSRTLMRHAVKRPVRPKPKAVSGAKTMSDVARPVRASDVHAQIVSTHADQARAERARKIDRSKLVSRFGAPSTHQPLHQPIAPKLAALPVKPAPAAAPARKLPAVATKPHPAESVIALGLKNAQSHTEKPLRRTRKTRRSRVASIAAGSMAVVLLATFFAYQNVPNLSMRYAAAKAGINASIPGYKPAGFALNHRIQYTDGQVTLSFRSNSDERNFSIVQRSSNWNSDTLRTAYVAEKDNDVQTFEDKGRTIYLYGGSNATWVNGGVWYDINGDSRLTSDQLIRIASSM